MPKIDRNSPVPLHFQLHQILLGKIWSGEWGPGSLIPGELELQQTYDLSRNTVRQTLNALVAKKCLERHRGRGTFVSVTGGKIVHNPANPGGFDSTMTWSLISEQWLDAPPAPVVETMGLETGARVYRIERARLAEGEPIGRLVSYVPDAVVDRIDRAGLTAGDSTAYLTPLPELDHALVNRDIEAVDPTDEDRAVFRPPPGVPVLRITRNIRVGAASLEYMIARYRGDKFKYQLVGHLRGNSS